MKALRVYKDAVLKVEDIPEPIVDDNSVKVKVAACGVCGSDIPRIFDNKAHYYPIVLGHEFSGCIAELGRNVKDLNVGDHVVVAPLLPCHQCIDCQNGNFSLCKNYSFIGSRVQGAMAEYVVVPAENVIVIDKSIDLRDAAIIEPLTVALHAFNQNHYVSNKKVAILGMGTIGCLCAQVARAKGANHITAFVRNDKHNELAIKCGVDSIIDTSKIDWQSRVDSITEGRGYDFVFETAGSSQTIKQCFEIAANKSHVCMIGTPKNEVSFTVKEWELINRKEFYLTGSWMSYSAPFPGSAWNEAVELLRNKDVIIHDGICCKKYGLIEAANSLKDVREKCNDKGRFTVINKR